MKKLLLLLICLSATSLMGKPFKDNTLKWEDRPLTLDDFMGKKLKSDTMSYQLYWVIKTRQNKVKVPHGRIIYLQTYLTLDKNKSYLTDSCRKESMLPLYQTGFNLLEFYRRKSTYDLAENPGTDYSDIVNYYYREYLEKMETIEDSTHYGQNKEAMDKYIAEVNDMLTLPEIDPTEIPLGNRYSGIDLYVGYNLRYSPNDFHTNALSGISVGYSFDVRRHLIGLDMTCNFGGKSKQDFETEYGPINKDSKVESMHGSLMYGYLVNPQSKNPLYPTVHIGFTNMSGDEVTQSDGKKKTPSLQGFCFGLGCRYDIPLFETIRLNNIGNLVFCNWSTRWLCTASRSRLSMQIRPKLLFTQMEGSFYPSFNLSVALSWNTMLFGYKQIQ